MANRVPTYKPPHAGLPSHRPVRPRSGDAAAWKRFIDGRPWRKLAALYRSQHPICEWCLSAHDILVPAEQVHHMKGQDPEFVLDPEWLMSLCKGCHSRISLAERRGETVTYPPRVDGGIEVGNA